MLGPLAQAERHPLQLDAALAVTPGHEQLGQVRQHGTGTTTAGVRVEGNVAPAQHDQILGRGQLGDGGHGLLALGQVGLFLAGPLLLRGPGRGQEGQARRVGARGRQVEVADLTEEGVRDLGQDAGAVPGAGVAALGPAVLEVAQRGEGFGHHVMPWFAGQISDEGNAACVMLETAVVKALSLARSLAYVLVSTGRRHAKLLSSLRSCTAVGTTLALPRRPLKRLAGYVKVTLTLHHRTNPAQDLEDLESLLVEQGSHQLALLTLAING